MRAKRKDTISSLSMSSVFVIGIKLINSFFPIKQNKKTKKRFYNDFFYNSIDINVYHGYLMGPAKVMN